MYIILYIAFVLCEAKYLYIVYINFPVSLIPIDISDLVCDKPGYTMIVYVMCCTIQVPSTKIDCSVIPIIHQHSPCHRVWTLTTVFAVISAPALISTPPYILSL